MKKLPSTYHTARQPHTENDIGLKGSLGDGHDYCREVEKELQARLDAALAEAAELLARRDESRGTLLDALRGGR